MKVTHKEAEDLLSEVFDRMSVDIPHELADNEFTLLMYKTWLTKNLEVIPGRHQITRSLLRARELGLIELVKDRKKKCRIDGNPKYYYRVLSNGASSLGNVLDLE